ncbi:YihY/virulence factor BrkB family protein [Chengkuizengella axinellae]|uniref:YihY/virulence factor BrkB family protein n=1 Tax=Chengkuizengella axinellae TaxID=3064388 RepID=A0ABT9IZA7_9BACL|nr:YihY/virulence factor BrkB family protein [Chengkuizengella sp. 2205SS18-9]MDP5274704.1 YihY/virulence factor BrkB family protein [Chengkuizengella sp. 2205SS18-9]
MKIKPFFNEMICRVQDDEVNAIAAQLTYYQILSFFPFLIFLITLLSYTTISRQDVLDEITGILPENTDQMILNLITETVSSRSETLLSLGMIATIWTASRGVMAIIRGINKAYDEAENRHYVVVRGISILYTLYLALVLLVLFIMLVFGEVIGRQVFSFFELPQYFGTVWGMMQYLIPLVVIFFVFVFLYHSAPNRKLKYKEVFPGAIFTTTGLIVVSLLFSIYINNFGNFAKTYGSIGGVIALLIWMYLINITIILGGEINAALTNLREGKRREQCKPFGYYLILPFKQKKEK